MNTSLKSFQQQEEKSLKHIQDHVKKSIKAKVKYKRESKQAQAQEIHQSLIPGESIKNFWKKCICNFNEQMETLFPEPVEMPKYRNCGDYEISWSDSMDHLRWAYEDVKEEYGIQADEAQITDGLFKKLTVRLLKEQKSTVPRDKLVFGRTHFKYLINLLDLRDKEIRKLLPYLLTAYTCNSGRNSFLSKENTEGVIHVLTSFSDKGQDSDETKKDPKCNEAEGYLDYDKANKLVLSSKKLNRVFSLSQYHAESIFSINHKVEGSDGPEPLIWANVLRRAETREIPVPLIRYKELAEEIFGFWVSAINETVSSESQTSETTSSASKMSETTSIVNVDGLPEDIDLEMCCALFNHYCADVGQNEPGK